MENCKFCNGPVLESKSGHKRIYCSPTCRDQENRLVWLQHLKARLRDSGGRITDGKKRSLK